MRVDFGTIGYSLHIPGLLPQANDGFAELEGDSWGIGYNLGLLYEFSKNTRAGIAYRSRIEHTLDGDVDFSKVPAPLIRTFQGRRYRSGYYNARQSLDQFVSSDQSAMGCHGRFYLDKLEPFQETRCRVR